MKMKKFGFIALLFWGNVLGMVYVGKKEIPGAITAMALSSNGHTMVIGTCGGPVFLADLTSSNTAEFCSYVGLRDSVAALAIADVIAVGYNCGHICILDNQLRKLQDIVCNVSDIKKMLLEGSLLIILSKDSRVIIWDIDKSECLVNIEIYKNVRTVSMSVERGRLFLADGPNLVVWDMVNKKELAVLRGHKRDIVSLAQQHPFIFSSSCDGTICQWQIETGKCEQSFLAGERIESMAMSCDKRTLIAASKDGSCFAWDISTGYLLEHAAPQYFSLVSVLVVGNVVLFGYMGGGIRVYNMAAYKSAIQFFNETVVPIENIEFIDWMGYACSRSVRCAPYSSVPIETFFRDAASGYELYLSSGDQCVTYNSLALASTKKIALINDIATGDLLLDITKKIGSKDGDCAEHLIRSGITSGTELGRSGASDMSLLIYTIGKAIKSLAVRDSLGNVVAAKQDETMKGLWDIANLHRHAPYRLSAETVDAMYHWDIPFLSESTELMLSHVSDASPKLKLLMETSWQKYVVPLVEVKRK